MKLWSARILLAILVAIIYTQTAWNEFVEYDDQLVITQNPDIAKGLTPEGLAWAFSTSYFANWMPLTWLTHLADYEFYRDWAGGHHLTSALFHLIAVLLLFEALRKMTNQAMLSLIVAAIYATHPMHVESVAWVSERKGNLSSVFWMLTMYLYARYVKAPSIERMAAVAGSLFAGLMAKQMLVSLPLILLLLDFWPLHRRDTFFGLRARPLWPLIREKWSLFLIAAFFIPVAYLMQERGEAISTLEGLNLNYRLQNVIYSTVMYLRRFFWPSDLAVFYPHPKDSLSISVLLGCLCILLGITILAFLLRKKMPWNIVGWFWYLIALTPVSGIIPIGSHGMADRYGDIPLIGISIATVWTLYYIVVRFSVPRFVTIPATAATICLLVGLSYVQTSHWRNTETLFTSIIRVDPDNLIAQNGLGVIDLNKGELDTAAQHFQVAIHADKRFPLAHANLGTVLAQQGKLDDAVAEYREAAEWGYQPSWFAAARLLAQQNKTDEAIAACEYGFGMGPVTSDESTLYGVLLMRAQRYADAERALLTAIQNDPQSAEARLHLALSLLSQKRIDSARLQFAWAVTLNPAVIDSIESLVKSSKDQDPISLDILAACYSQVDKMGAACKSQEAALLQAAKQGHAELIEGMQARLRSYLNNIKYLQHASATGEAI
ncbi:tetratricopeptide repeat protein [bacterium]|nr:tetratricopeptide repeat protein [bacterium]